MTYRTAIRAAILAAAISAGSALAGSGAAAQTRSVWSPGIGVTLNTVQDEQERTWGPGVTVDLLRQRGRFGFGLEAGYQSLGTLVSRIDDFNQQPGWVYREEVKRSLIRLAAITRFELGSGSVRPYLVAGGGAYNARFHDHIEVHDANGQQVPFYDFEWSGSDVKAGATAGASVIFTRPRGGMGFALEGRWHGIFDVTEDGFGTADFLSLGLSLRW